jgi:hypothetical protein
MARATLRHSAMPRQNFPCRRTDNTQQTECGEPTRERGGASKYAGE